MKLIEAFLNKNTGIIDIFYNLPEPLEATIVISDVYLDCSYYVFDQLLVEGYSGWVLPFGEKLNKIILNNSKFAGFKIKIYNKEKRLLYSEKLYLNNAPSIIDYFYCPSITTTGDSYVDFFYGDLCRDIDTTGIVVDAGANVGFFTLYAEHNNAKRIYSIEPDSLSFFYLDKNFYNNSKVILINKAINNTNDIVNFEMNLDSCVGSTISKYNNKLNTKKIPIECITVNDILNIEDSINLLKLDVEGAEFDIIESMTSEQFKNVNQFFIEFHNKPEAIENKLVENGYLVEYRHSTKNNFSGFIYAKKHENS